MSFQSIDLPRHHIYLYESKHQSGDKVTMHHHDAYQILYALKGSGTVTVEQQTFAFNEDHLALLVPYSNHSVHTSASLTLLVLAFAPKKMDHFVQQFVADLDLEQSDVTRLHPLAAEEVRRSLRKMLFEQAQQDDVFHYAMNIHLLELLMALYRHRQAPPDTHMNSMRAEQIDAYIQTHFYESFTANHLAGKWNISVRYMNDIFKQQYGRTPMQHLTQVRMERAKTLLAATDKDIASICFEVGFETVSTFYRTFKNYVHASPNQYRQAHIVSHMK